MHPDPPERERSCPRRGCSAHAVVATDLEIAGGAHLWRCDEGHRGPRIVDYRPRR